MLSLLLLMVSIQLGRSLANLVAGAGWTWPSAGARDGAGAGAGGGAVESPLGPAFWSSLPGVLAGRSDAGLAVTAPGATSGGEPARLAGPGMTWTCVGLTVAAVIAAATWAGVKAYQRWGPGRMRGMATAAEAEKLLGITRLRRVAGIVRPDVYGRNGTGDAASGVPGAVRITAPGARGRAAVAHVRRQLRTERGGRAGRAGAVRSRRENADRAWAYDTQNTQANQDTHATHDTPDNRSVWGNRERRGER